MTTTKFTFTRVLFFSFFFLLAFSFCSKDEGKDPSPPPANGDNGSGGTENLTVTDREGNVYEAVQIGNQIWMAENLNVQEHTYGASTCPRVAGFTPSHILNYDIFCSMYGRLYSFHAIVDGANLNIHYRVQGLCPDGWYIPRDDDWLELEMFLGMSEEKANKIAEERGTNEGRMLKSESLWHNNGKGTNDFGFNVLPGGSHLSIILPNNDFAKRSFFWTSRTSLDNAYSRSFSYDSDKIHRGISNQGLLQFLRCIKDPDDVE